MSIRKRSQRELSEQIAVVRWFYHQHPSDVLIVSANGGSRNVLEAANLKRSGVRKGVPDIFLPVARHGFYGLFIELKRTHREGEAKARVSLEQKEMIQYLSDQGYYALVCFGFESAVDTIRQYMKD